MSGQPIPFPGLVTPDVGGHSLVSPPPALHSLAATPFPSSHSHVHSQFSPAFSPGALGGTGGMLLLNNSNSNGSSNTASSYNYHTSPSAAHGVSTSADPSQSMSRYRLLDTSGASGASQAAPPSLPAMDSHHMKVLQNLATLSTNGIRDTSASTSTSANAQTQSTLSSRASPPSAFTAPQSSPPPSAPFLRHPLPHSGSSATLTQHAAHPLLNITPPSVTNTLQSMHGHGHGLMQTQTQSHGHPTSSPTPPDMVHSSSVQSLGTALPQPPPLTALHSMPLLHTHTHPPQPLSHLSVTPQPQHTQQSQHPQQYSLYSQQQQQQSQPHQQQLYVQSPPQSHSPSAPSSTAPVTLQSQLSLLLTQQLQQQAQMVQLTSSPGQVMGALQQLTAIHQIAQSVILSATHELLHQIALIAQSSPDALAGALLQIAQHQQQHQRQQQRNGLQYSLMGQQREFTSVKSEVDGANFNGSNHGSIVGFDALAGGSSGTLSLNGKKKRLSGSSCHQCKTRRISAELVYCAQAHAKKGRQRKQRRTEDQASVNGTAGAGSITGGLIKSERFCRKKYCCRCLVKFYNENPPASIGPHGDKSWICPGCRGLCTCAACKRQQTKKESKKRVAEQTQEAINEATMAAQEGKDGHPPVFADHPFNSANRVGGKHEQHADDDASDSASSVSSQVSSNENSPSITTHTLAAMPAPAQLPSANLPAATTLVPSASPTQISMALASSLSAQTPGAGYAHLVPAMFPPSPQLPLTSLVPSLNASPLMHNANLSGGGHLAQLGHGHTQNNPFASAFLSPGPTFASLYGSYGSSPPQSPFQMPSQLLLPNSLLQTPFSSAQSSYTLSGAPINASPLHPLGQIDPTMLAALTAASPITWSRTIQHSHAAGTNTSTAAQPTNTATSATASGKAEVAG